MGRAACVGLSVPCPFRRIRFFVQCSKHEKRLLLPIQLAKTSDDLVFSGNPNLYFNYL